jgi:hypothetical protein
VNKPTHILFIWANAKKAPGFTFQVRTSAFYCQCGLSISIPFAGSLVKIHSLFTHYWFWFVQFNSCFFFLNRNCGNFFKTSLRAMLGNLNQGEVYRFFSEVLISVCYRFTNNRDLNYTQA